MEKVSGSAGSIAIIHVFKSSLKVFKVWHVFSSQNSLVAIFIFVSDDAFIEVDRQLELQLFFSKVQEGHQRDQVLIKLLAIDLIPLQPVMPKNISYPLVLLKQDFIAQGCSDLAEPLS